MRIRLFCCALVFGLAACGGEQQEQDQVLRSVRYVEVSDEAGGASEVILGHQPVRSAIPNELQSSRHYCRASGSGGRPA